MTQTYLKYLKDKIERADIGTVKFFKISKAIAEYTDFNRVFDEDATLKKEFSENSSKMFEDEDLILFHYSMRPKHVKHPREIKREELLLTKLFQKYPVRKITRKKIMETLNVSRSKAEKYLKKIKKAHIKPFSSSEEENSEEMRIFPMIYLWHHPFKSRYYVLLKGIDDKFTEKIRKMLEPNMHANIHIFMDNSAILVIHEKDDGIIRVCEYAENLVKTFETIEFEGIYKELSVIYLNYDIMEEIAETWDGKKYQVKLKD